MKRCFSNILVFLTLFCCTTEKEVFSPSTDETTENYEDPINQIIDSFDEYNNDESHLSDYIYDQDKLHRFDIYITEKIKKGISCSNMCAYFKDLIKTYFSF